MKNLRRYILKTWIVCIICAGVLLAFCKPVEASNPACNFTDWLQASTSVKLSPQVAQKLADLSRSGLNFNTLLKRAEKILIDNNVQSDLSKKGMSPENIRQYLLMKWNWYKTGKDLHAVTSKRIKISLSSSSNIDQALIGGVCESFTRNEQNNNFQKYSGNLTLFSNRVKIIPLVNEISIGAP